MIDFAQDDAQDDAKARTSRAHIVAYVAVAVACVLALGVNIYLWQDAARSASARKSDADAILARVSDYDMSKLADTSEVRAKLERMRKLGDMVAAYQSKTSSDIDAVHAAFTDDIMNEAVPWYTGATTMSWMFAPTASVSADGSYSGMWLAYADDGKLMAYAISSWTDNQFTSLTYSNTQNVVNDLVGSDAEADTYGVGEPDYGHTDRGDGNTEDNAAPITAMPGKE